jgi:HEAT repeat protein
MREGKSNGIISESDAPSPPPGDHAAETIARGGQDPVPGLIDRLNTQDDHDILAVLDDLTRLGPLAAEAIPGIAKKLLDQNSNIRKTATRALGQMGPQAIEILTQCLAHEDKEVRRQAIWALGRMGSQASRAVTAICSVLDDADSRVAFGAAQALGNIGPQAAPAIPSLIAALSGPNPIQCRLVAWAIGEIGPAALPELLAKLEDPDPKVRQEVAAAIGYMGPAAKSAVGPILLHLRRRSADLSRQSTVSKSKEQFKALSPTQMPDADVATDDRIGLIDALARMGFAASEAREYLTATTGDANRNVAQAAAQALLRVMGWS